MGFLHLCAATEHSFTQCNVYLKTPPPLEKKTYGRRHCWLGKCIVFTKTIKLIPKLLRKLEIPDLNQELF